MIERTDVVTGTETQEGSTVPQEARQFLQVIATMQSESEERARIIGELRYRKLLVEEERDKNFMEREAVVAKLADARAQLLQLDVEHRELQKRQRSSESEILENSRQSQRCRTLLSTCRGDLTVHPMVPNSASELAAEATAAGTSSAAHNAYTEEAKWLKHLFITYGQLYNGTDFLQELRVSMKNLYVEVSKETHNTVQRNLSDWEATCLQSLPHLTADERTLLHFQLMLHPFV
ncbi:hypothetical protein, conserved [Trypanosoma brucei gambiense DAL972]|uniref:Uncharacterized protein n=1 Tax=Trypanosoma brucei gambiense (strain MHOM/CI/86/DAL972) TaxID=679716 RepID=C9ZRJ1_TRYB9|nr:hypothetical protein, conserved [Trypanosoma brucei gambiense DAL972]CBH12293.1 hypothetical protein, conserved [Trypanosoma brucei gambiense DAL972]|eukprot:XP_011774574.1 hypothetical protein, conserved [Trypanosoma brucei gambiense DAL972]